MRLVFMVTGEISEATFADALTKKHEVVGLVTQPDRPVGRKQVMTAPRVKEIALLSFQKQPLGIRSTNHTAQLALNNYSLFHWIINFTANAIIEKRLFECISFAIQHPNGELVPNMFVALLDAWQHHAGQPLQLL